MATIFKPKGRDGFVVQYRRFGRQYWKRFDTRDEPKRHLAEVLQYSDRVKPDCDPKICVSDYSVKWIDVVRVNASPRTVENYESVLSWHILAAFGGQQVRDITRAQIQSMLISKLNGGMKRATVAGIYKPLRAMLNAAMHDGIISTNPASGLGRYLKLGSEPSHEDGEQIKALDRDQLYRLLGSVEGGRQRTRSTMYVLFMTGALAGLRIAELIGLKWSHLDFQRREIHVSEQISRGRHGTLKTKHSRRVVPMSPALAQVLHTLHVQRKAETLKRGWQGVPELVFCSEVGTRLDESRIRQALDKAISKAGLPHFTPHSLRHTFVSQLLSKGVNPEAVSRWAGHSSVAFTCKVYGRWLPMQGAAAVNVLDRVFSNPVAQAVANGVQVPAVEDFAGQPLGGRP